MNSEQQTAHDQIVRYITTSDEPFKMITLSGYAGTGKSFTLSHVVRTLRTKGWGGKIAMTAPTHKAVRVLKRFAHSMPDVAFATIHSLLGLREQTDHNGKIKFVQSRDPNQIRIEGFKVVLLDEASMLQDELLKLMIPYVRKGMKLIFIGDRAQLPPVGLVDSIPFLEDKREELGIGIVKLESIVRQAMDNPILELATHIRNNYRSLGFLPIAASKINPVTGDGIELLTSKDEERTLSIIREYFTDERFRQDADYMKILAWRNQTVDQFNRIVRKYIFPNLDPVPYLMEGEKMIVDRPVMLSDNKILLSANEEVVVVRFEEDTETITYTVIVDMLQEIRQVDVKFYMTWVKHFNHEGVEETVNIRILHEEDQPKMATILKEISSSAMAIAYNSPHRTSLWRMYYATERKFAAMKYNYALTVHKSQGSSYDNCMMVDWDIAANRNIAERNRCRYVAVTRPRHKLFILK